MDTPHRSPATPAGRLKRGDAVRQNSAEREKLEENAKSVQKAAELVANSVANLPTQQAHLGTVLAPRKLGKGEEDVKDDTFKTFHWSLVGTQSHPAELGQQPEASLAWGSAMITAKRRQPVPKPCY